MAGKIIPTGSEVAREAIIVVAGAIVAALVIGQMPRVRDWIKRQWGGNPPQAL